MLDVFPPGDGGTLVEQIADRTDRFGAGLTNRGLGEESRLDALRTGVPPREKI